jgi:3-oxoacyl-[acyl-carrier-protein] synthase-3
MPGTQRRSWRAPPGKTTRNSILIRSVVRGIGSALPRRIMKNADFEGIVETSDEWIVQRTGIRQRHIAEEGETTASLGEAAARAALTNAALTPDDIDLIVVATSTPDNTFPATAVDIQSRLGMRHGFAFDMQAVCSGFVYAITTADLYLKGGLAKRVLVIGAETFSRILDWTDRGTCVLFGDGAGALILEAEESEGRVSDRGVIASSLRSDGAHKDKLFVDGGPGTTGTVGHLRMEGREVFKHAVGMITDVIEDTYAKAGIASEDLDWFVPHQANKRIIDASAKKLGIAEDKVVTTVQLHGNTSAASVPLALSVAVADGRIKKGDLVLLEAMGGGFTWGAVLVRW